MKHLLVVLVALFCAGGASAEKVQFTSADRTVITGHWFATTGNERRPAVIALHGCGGLYRRDGTTLDARYPEYVARLQRAGYHVLLPDSFGSRGSGPICALAREQRTISSATRRADVAAAVNWLAARADVDPRRIALLGWSHGAGTALNAINALQPLTAHRLAGAALFYPGCRAALAQPHRIELPVLLLLGEKDDWTPPAPCLQLAQQTRAAQPDADLTVKIYADSYHGFDSTRPERFRADVSTGVNRGGVHVGANAAARAQSLQQLDSFLARIFR